MGRKHHRMTTTTKFFLHLLIIITHSPSAFWHTLARRFGIGFGFGFWALGVDGISAQSNTYSLDGPSRLVLVRDYVLCGRRHFGLMKKKDVLRILRGEA